MKPYVVVIEGASGVGKDTIARELVNRYGIYVKMPSITDRSMRPMESQGNPYFFVTTEEFKKKIETGDVFEYTVMSRDSLHRGMSKQIIEQLALTGKIQIKDCDWVGIQALKREYGESQVLAILLDVPSEEIARRISERGGEIADIESRIKDIEEYSTKIRDFCDVVVENIDLDKCVAKVHQLVKSKWNLSDK